MRALARCPVVKKKPDDGPMRRAYRVVGAIALVVVLVYILFVVYGFLTFEMPDR